MLRDVLCHPVSPWFLVHPPNHCVPSSATAVAMVVFTESAYTANEADNSVTVGVALGPDTVLDPDLSIGVRVTALRFGQWATYKFTMAILSPLSPKQN